MDALFQINYETFAKRAKRVINKLKQNEFSTYEFLEEFRRQYESSYLQWLMLSIATDNKRKAFKEVHTMVGRLLSNMAKAKKPIIASLGKSKPSPDVFGDDEQVEQWIIIK